MRLRILALVTVSLFLMPGRTARAAATGAASGQARAAAPAPAAPVPSKFLYTCAWKGQTVALTPVKYVRVDRLKGAVAVGKCSSFDTLDPKFLKARGGAVKVYKAAARYGTNLVAFRAKAGKSTAFGTWTFPPRAVLVPKTTVVLKPAALQNVVPPAGGKPLDTTAADLVITFKTLPAGLKVGSVLVSGVTPLTPYGMLRKVTAITLKPSSALVETAQAQLSDAISQGAFDVHQQLQNALAAAARLSHRSRPLIRTRDGFTLCPKIPSFKFGAAGKREEGQTFDADQGTLTVSGNACVTFGAPDWQESLGPLRTPRISFGIDGTDSVHLNWKTEGGAFVYDGEYPLIDETLPTIEFPVGPVPVVVVPKVSIKLGLQLQVNAYIAGGFSYNGQFTGAIDCGITGCGPTSTSSGDFATDPTTGGGTTSVTVYGGISLNFLFYNVFGPGVSVKVYGTATGGLDSTGACWKIVAGVKATISLKLKLWSYDWTGSYDFIKLEKTLAQKAPPCYPKISSFKADKASPVQVDTPVTFTATVSQAVDDGKYHIKILDAETNKPLRDDCTSGNTCAFTDNKEADPVERDVKAELTDSNGAVLDESGVVKQKWVGASITLSADTTTPELGRKVVFTTQVSDVLVDHFFVNLFEDGTIINGCADNAKCTFEVRHTDVGEHTFTAEVTGGTDNKRLALTENSTKAKWDASLSLGAADPTTFPPTVGDAVTIQASASGVELDHFHIDIVDETGATVATCADTKTTCSYTTNKETIENTTHTYTGRLFSPESKQSPVIKSLPFAVTWKSCGLLLKRSVSAHSRPAAEFCSIYQPHVTQVGSLAVGHGGSANLDTPVGSSVQLTASWQVNVDAKTHIAVWRVLDTGQSYDCPAGTTCYLNYRETGATSAPKSHTFALVVQSINADGTRTDLETTPESAKATWQPFTISVAPTPAASSANSSSMTINTDTSTTVQLAITVSINVLPENQGGYSLYVDSGSGSYKCPQLTSCPVQIPPPASGQSATGTYVINVRDDATNTEWKVFTVTISWSGGSGGGGCGGVSVTSLTPSNPSPAHNQMVTLTATTSGAVPSGCKVQIAAPNPNPKGNNGYIYDQCVGPTPANTPCSTRVPTGDPQGCSDEGSGSCDYVAYIAVVGTSTPVGGEASTTVTWASALRAAYSISAPSAGKARKLLLTLLTSSDRVPLADSNVRSARFVGRALVPSYDIPVRNEFTGEVRIVVVQSQFYVDAQIAALHRLFKEEGWRKATALQPHPTIATP